MQFQYRYFGSSNVQSSSGHAAMSFAPDTLREPTFFVADLGQHLPFREAISALHDVVVSDLRMKPKDRTEYFAWLEREEQNLLAEFIAQKGDVEAKIKPIRAELQEINKRSYNLLKPYYKAQKKYFDYLYTADYDAWFVLDPVITVHPDEVFFECFSQDESSYGRLSCSYNVFKKIDEHACGTTNIDYSDSLYQEFQKIRTYKNTQFKVDPGGFEVQTADDDRFQEQKIDLPDSWVRGFLQVNSALTLPHIVFDLHPMDMHNICFVLRRRKERSGPRSLRFCLTPDKPVEIVIDPWGTKLTCPRSIFRGSEAHEIRIWGRRRLFILERLIPVARRFTVRLLGSGLPSIYVADLGDMSFTLGLSGWTANDWSRMGNFDLMAPRGEVDKDTAARVIEALGRHWVASADLLAQELSLDRAQVKSALSLYAQLGRVLYDTQNDVYRLRDLSREPLPMDKLRFSNEREEKATGLCQEQAVTLGELNYQKGQFHIQGVIKEEQREHQTEIIVDGDERLVSGTCSCHFYGHNKMHKGPCEHMLALRMMHTKEKIGSKRLEVV